MFKLLATAIVALGALAGAGHTVAEATHDNVALITYIQLKSGEMVEEGRIMMAPGEAEYCPFLKHQREFTYFMPEHATGFILVCEKI